MRKLRTLLIAYREAGGARPVVLFHDDEHGGALIDALARHGDGLPANVLPVAVNEVTQVGLEAIAAAFAYGASGRARFCCAPSRATTWPGCTKTIALAAPILAGLGFGGIRVATIETDDPDRARRDACARSEPMRRRRRSRQVSRRSAASAT